MLKFKVATALNIKSLKTVFGVKSSECDVFYGGIFLPPLVR
jgi:hypothetical protein